MTKRPTPGSLVAEALIATSGDAVFATSADGVIESWNPGAEKMLGYAPAEAVGRDAAMLLGDEERQAAQQLVESVIESGAAATYEGVRVSSSGEPVEVAVTISPLTNGSGRVLGVMHAYRDLRERIALEREVSQSALNDKLTDLANRQLFKERLVHALARRKRHDVHLAVLAVDLDDFKLVNEALGHEVGDELLVRFSKRLARCVRPTDTVARLGSDEFALLLEDMVDPRDAITVADRILAELRPAFKLRGRPTFMRASVGICMGGPPEAEPEDLLRGAEVALHSAKAKGKSRYEVYEPGLRSATVKRLELQTDLRHALDNGGVEIAYQPIIELASGRIEGVEALARWTHPDNGPISPGEFIPLAEDTGLIHLLGRAILDGALAQAAEWRKDASLPEIRISVNVSIHQLRDPGFEEVVTRALERHGVPPSKLILEITESVFAQDSVEMQAALRKLKEASVSIALDDFGTGYSSLGYLNRLPIDILKVDRAFVRGFAQGPEESAVGHAIVRLSQTLEKCAVAEGIELSEQVARLRSLGCKYGQGFYFAKPLPAASVEPLLRSERFGFQALDDWQLGDRILHLPA